MTTSGERRPGRRYYGWYVVAACNVVAVMTWGIGVFNQGVFLGYYADAFGWSRADLSFGPLLFYVWAGIVGVAIGRLIDRRGPRPILAVGAVLLGAGTTALGLAREPWQIHPGFLLLGSGYACLHTVTLGAIISRWFVQQRARAMGAATFGASVGGVILAPLNAAVLERWGGPAGGLLLAAIAILLVVPLAVWVVKDGPEAVGQRLDEETGDSIQATGGARRVGARLASPADQQAADEREWRVAEAARTLTFWAIAVCFHLTMMAQGGFLVHQVLFLQPTFGFVAAAIVVSATTLAGAVGRALFTLLGDRWPPQLVAASMFAIQAAGLGLSALGTAPWALVVGSCIFGLTMGVVVSIQPLVVAHCFGRRSFGRVYGPIYLAIQLGTGFGSLVFGLTATAFGSYRPVLGIVSLTLLLAALGMRWAQRPAVASAGGPLLIGRAGGRSG